MSEEEYLQLDRNAWNARYEYIDGVARLMAGGSIEADRIGFNVRSILTGSLRAGPCTVFGPDVQVLIGVKPNGRNDYYYPDCTISCDPADRRRGTKLIRSPRVAIEVLSPGTEKDDRGKKLDHYEALPTMHEIVLISQFAPHVEVYTREKDSVNWKHTMYRAGESVLLESMGVELAMDEIYEGVNFDEPLPSEIE